MLRPSPRPRSRADRAARQEERGLSRPARLVLLVTSVALFGMAALALRTPLSTPRLTEAGLTHRVVTLDGARYDAVSETILLPVGAVTYALTRDVWQGRADGETVAASLARGAGALLWVVAADTSRALVEVVGIETAALVVPKARGLKHARDAWWTNVWAAAFALLGALYALYLAASRRSARLERTVMGDG